MWYEYIRFWEPKLINCPCLKHNDARSFLFFEAPQSATRTNWSAQVISLYRDSFPDLKYVQIRRGDTKDTETSKYRKTKCQVLLFKPQAEARNNNFSNDLPRYMSHGCCGYNLAERYRTPHNSDDNLPHSQKTHNECNKYTGRQREFIPRTRKTKDRAVGVIGCLVVGLKLLGTRVDNAVTSCEGACDGRRVGVLGATEGPWITASLGAMLSNNVGQRVVGRLVVGFKVDGVIEGDTDGASEVGWTLGIHVGTTLGWQRCRITARS